MYIYLHNFDFSGSGELVKALRVPTLAHFERHVQVNLLQQWIISIKLQRLYASQKYNIEKKNCLFALGMNNGGCVNLRLI